MEFTTIALDKRRMDTSNMFLGRNRKNERVTAIFFCFCFVFSSQNMLWVLGEAFLMSTTKYAFCGALRKHAYSNILKILPSKN